MKVTTWLDLEVDSKEGKRIGYPRPGTGCFTAYDRLCNEGSFFYDG